MRQNEQNVGRPVAIIELDSAARHQKNENKEIKDAPIWEPENHQPNLEK